MSSLDKEELYRIERTSVYVLRGLGVIIAVIGIGVLIFLT